MPDMTVGDLKRHLQGIDDNTDLEFGGGLTFYRLKFRGDNLVVLEWNEAEAELKPKTREYIQVAFIKSVDFEDGEVIKEVTVPRL